MENEKKIELNKELQSDLKIVQIVSGASAIKELCKTNQRKHIEEKQKQLTRINVQDIKSHKISSQNISGVERTIKKVQAKNERKFRPPKSQYQLRREREAELSLKQSIELSVSNYEPAADNPTKTSKHSDSSIPSNREVPSDCSHSKLIAINAWLAQKDPNRCYKQTSSLNRMKNRQGLIATYKCMARRCSFYTVSQRNFAKHLLHHESANSQEEFLLFCPYCIFKGTTSDNLIDHYNVHMFDKFQCGHCFYRSAVDRSCVEHIKTYHELESELIYECPLETAPNFAINQRLVRCREENVKPLNCSSN